jgi:hypothetical protein
MKITYYLFFILPIWLALTEPVDAFGKASGLLPLPMYSPVLVQNFDSCKISCKDVRVFVNNNCIYEITPAEVLGECFSLFQGYVIVYDGVSMTPVKGGVIDRLGIFPFSLFNPKGGLVCLGQVYVRDTIGPVFKDDVAKRDWESRDTLILSENDIVSVFHKEITWSQPGSPLFLGTPLVKDGCSPNFISRKVEDELISFPCDTVISFGKGISYAHLTAKIKRTFTFTDNSANKTLFVQEIFFRKLGASLACESPEKGLYDYAPLSIFAFGPLGDNPRLTAHPDFPTGKIDLNTSFYRCEAPDNLIFDVCSISDSLALDRIIKAVYSASYQWPNGFKDTLSLFDKQDLWRVSYKTKVYSACNDGKRVRIILTIEDNCQKKMITDTLWIYFSRTSGPSFPALSATGGNIVLGRDAANPVFIPLPGNTCKSNILLPFTHGTDERDLGKWFNWTVKDVCTPRANLLLSYQVESKLISVAGKMKSSTAWNKLNYPLVHTALGSSINDVPAGTHRIIVAATAGECEAISYDTLYFVLQDQVFPRVRCKPTVSIPLLYPTTSNWYIQGRNNKVYARLRTDMVNNGSTDNCSLDTLYLRRMVSSACILDNFLGNPDYDYYGNNDGKVTLSDFERINVGTHAGLYFTPRYMPYVEYFCCDVGKENVAELWARDIGFDALANSSSCEVKVQLVDLMNPIVFRPDAKDSLQWMAKNWVSCSDTAAMNALKDEFKSNAIFGAPSIYGLDCTGKVTYHTVPSVQCGMGQITRHWTVEKLVDNVAVTVRDSQKILVRPSHRFRLNIPADTTAFCAKEAAQTLTASSEDCNLLAISFVDSLLNRQNKNGACITIQRTYTVINWCDVPSNVSCADISTNPAKYVRVIPRQFHSTGKAMPFYHVISKRNADTLRWLSEEDPVVFDTIRISSGPSLTSLSTKNLSDYPAENELLCDKNQVFAWKYHQILTLTDTIKPTISIPDTSLVILSNGTCEGPISLSFSVSDNCPFSDISIDSAVLFSKNTPSRLPWKGLLDQGKYQNGLLTVQLHGIVPGNYDLWVSVKDNCRQISTATLPISVVPSDFQSLDCVETLTKNMVSSPTGDGFVKVSVQDVLSDKTLVARLSVCSPGSFFSIKKVSDISAAYLPVVSDSILVLPCGFQHQIVHVKVFLTDKNGKYTSCTLKVVIEDSLNICGPKVTVSGAIITNTAKPLPQVKVNLTSSLNIFNAETKDDGVFSIQQVPTGGPYVLKPLSPNDFKNGVSTLDLVLLQRQLLQGNVLKTPFQFIAADIDNSGTISIRDILELRKLVINLTVKFEKNTSWRFIPNDFIFPDSLNPWKTPFPEEITFPSIAKDTAVSFKAIKIGDLSGDAPAIQTPGVLMRSETAPISLFYTVSDATENGDYLVSFFFNKKNIPDGFQSSIQWPSGFSGNITFLPGMLKEENVNIQTDRNYLHVSAEKLTGDGTLFSLRFSSHPMPPRDFYLSTGMLRPEAYIGSQIFPVQLINKDIQQEEFMFYPAVPNPFNKETLLSFYLPQAAFTEIVISDLSGRVLKKISGNGVRGLNEWILNLAEIDSGNLLLCKIKAGGYEGLQQIIRIK